ncbi:MAG: ABC transporter permease [Gemmatimonadaceae bacterium]|nr:ABC transporter permease [Gemmatimonadaceae bacterium]
MVTVTNRLLHDARLSLRGLRRTPTFSVTATLILGVGIGMAVAMVTVYNAVLLRKLPVHDQDGIAILWPYHQRGVEFPLAPSALFKFRGARTMKDVAGFAHWGAHPLPISDGDRPLILPQSAVTGNFFEVLGAQPHLGRLLRREDDVAGAAPVLVLSYSAWRRQFNGDSAIVGHRLLNPIMGWSYTIIGVAPPGLDFPVGARAWAPLAAAGQFPVDLLARLRPGATPAAAAAEVLTVANEIHKGQMIGAEGYTLAHAVLGDVRPILLILTSAVALLLAIVCVNVGNLLLLRATTRAREFAVRRGLGATFGDIVRQLLVESAIVGVAGGLLGLVIAYALIQLLVTVAPAGLPRLDIVVLNGTPLALAVGVTLVAVLGFGLFPACSASRGDIESALRLDSRAGTLSRSTRRVRQWLVASQVALALVMIAGAALLTRSLDRLRTAPLGYTSAHLSIFEMTFPYIKYNSEQKYMALFDEVYTRLRAVPGVSSLTPVIIPPFLGPSVWAAKPEVDGQSKAEADVTPSFGLEAGNAEYFQTFGMRLTRGREFTEQDRRGAPAVVVVSDAVAKRLWPGQDALGKRIRFTRIDSTEWRTVVGVVDDVRFRALRETTPTVYLPWRQFFTQGLFAIRSPADPAQLLPAMRAALREIDPALVLVDGRPMDELLDENVAQPRISAYLMSAFGIVALFLAAIGLYGVMASIVREQTRHIGIRMALGAAPDQIRNGVLRTAMTVVSLGGAAGLIMALMGAQLLSKLLYEVSPADPIALIASCVLLLATGVLAAYFPAHRATRIDPAITLRSE